MQSLPLLLVFAFLLAHLRTVSTEKKLVGKKFDPLSDVLRTQLDLAANKLAYVDVLWEEGGAARSDPASAPATTTTTQKALMEWEFWRLIGLIEKGAKQRAIFAGPAFMKFGRGEMFILERLLENAVDYAFEGDKKEFERLNFMEIQAHPKKEVIANWEFARGVRLMERSAGRKAMLASAHAFRAFAQRDEQMSMPEACFFAAIKYAFSAELIECEKTE